MADKFPEIGSAAGDDADFEGDFLSREKELVGDEFTTEEDSKILNDDEDDEINEFKEQFPEVDSSEPPVSQESIDKDAKDDDDDDGDDFDNFESNGVKELNLSESEPIKAWKQQQEILEKAKSTIDDFYENYNLKKDNHSKDILTEQEKFLNKRDDFLGRGTLWDRVNELVQDVGELPDGDRDKTRFKELLTKLKGKENVPGAGGYQE
ncbi:Clathrin light chain [Candida viswanathii]|uniref:Clathrin light chain n=1 Tax=Candida viswanathii TaxID=5486 RepID=A0A367XZE2_9ASCO|nr:Clathrin light chain [Candida viswanathii]